MLRRHHLKKVPVSEVCGVSLLAFAAVPCLPACDSPDDETAPYALDIEEDNGPIEADRPDPEDKSFSETIALIAEEDDALDQLRSDNQEADLKTEFDLSATPAPPRKVSAYTVGAWYQVCAQDLTVYNNGKIGTLYKGTWLRVAHFGDGYNHVWTLASSNGGQSVYWGWVYNGWFC